MTENALAADAQEGMTAFLQKRAPDVDRPVAGGDDQHRPAGPAAAVR